MNQKGITRIAIIIIIIVLIGLAALGYYLFPKFFGQTKEELATGNTNVTTNINSCNISLPSVPEPLTAWNTDWRNDSIYLDVIPSTADETVAACEGQETLSERNSCFGEIATAFRNPLYCEKIDVNKTTEETKNSNEYSIANEYEIGLTTPQEDAIVCIQDFIREYGAYDCGTHTSDQFKDYCYYNAATSPYLLKNKTLNCCPIKDSDLKKQCDELVSGYKEDEKTLQNLNEALGEFKEVINVACYLKDHPELMEKFPAGEIRDGFKAESENETECPKLSDSEIQNVLRLVNTDQDGDGLNLASEKLLMTDDTKKDTDGDGYDDLTEINSGYDPTGPGKL